MGKGRALIGVAAGVLSLVVVTAVLACQSDAQIGGYGTGLRPGTVPSRYVQAVLTAGSICEPIRPSIIAAQIETESNWQPQARSPVGAQGIAQFMPGTWAQYGRDVDGDGKTDVGDPDDAIVSMGHYDCALAAIITAAVKKGRIHGDVVELTLAAYNAGIGRVLSAHGIPKIPETTAYVAKVVALTAKYSDASGASGPVAARAIAAARSQLGVTYSWGGGSYAGPSAGASGRGFDCSGLVLYAFYQGSGGRLRLPHSAHDQVVHAASYGGRRISPADLQPGDLIAFRREGDARAHHIGIYLGGGQLLHAPSTGDVVKIVPLNVSYWKEQEWLVARYS